MVFRNILLFLLMVFSGCSLFSNQEKNIQDKKADIHFAHGTYSLKNKNYIEALDKLITADSLRPNDSKILNNLGMAYYFRKDTTSAIAKIKKSLEVDPKNSDARNNLGTIYFNLGKYKLAQQQYEAILTDLVYQGQFRVLYNLALIYFKRGDSLNANQYLEKSLAENPSYCPSYFLKARIFEEARNLEEAYKHYRKAYGGVCYKQPVPHFKAGEVLTKMGKYEQAVAKYNDIVEMFPNTKHAVKATEKILQIQNSSIYNGSSDAYTERMQKIEEEVKKYQAPSF